MVAQAAGLPKENPVIFKMDFIIGAAQGTE